MTRTCAARHVTPLYPGHPGCQNPATRRIRIGCVHEHLGYSDACDQHLHPTELLRFLCAHCATSTQPHNCPIHVIETTPLPST